MLSVEDFFNEPNVCGDMGFVLSDSEGSFPSQEVSNEGNGWSPSPSIKSDESSSSLTLPGEESELNSLLSVRHLLKAYGEAMEKGQSDLADVIMRCVSEKVSLAGEPLLRLAFNLSQDLDKHGNYLKQESSKNFEAAFRAFYQIFPYGRFAHFAANSAILEAMPVDTETIHIVDFDMGEGIQWPPMLEALARLQKGVKLTTIKWENEDCDRAPLMWSFEEAKRRLLDHARGFGLMLKVEEMAIEHLVSEIKRRKKRGNRKEFLVFNCMMGLPHMGRIRSRKAVEEFLRVAKESMANSVNKGIITIGDGDSWENLNNFSGFGSFFEGNMVHYQALLESIESEFPVHLAEARMALECLFVAPCISSEVWLEKWMEIKECCNVEMGSSLEGWRISRESMEEAREMVKGNENSYGLKIGGQWKNEMILEWKGNPLVRVSAWKN
ncbi:protein NODULATION SIGNALING PATHWAY 2 isoform X2 [Hevea brasiliensis]|nr:protein NODULATION SIGNALING PATHWAY 2 isoform X2 [Hevea brasiliensis]